MPKFEVCTPEQAEFISHYNSECAKSEERMRLRDQFAAAALTGLLAAAPKGYLPEGLAQEAYAIAEAMLSAKWE